MLLKILSENYTTVLIGGIVFLLVVLFMRSRRQREKNLPPGPFPLPVIGNLLHLAAGNTILNFRKLRVSYGDVFSLYLGRQLVVVISGYEALHESLVKQADVFSGRVQSLRNRKLDTYDEYQANGIIRATDGPIWKKNRRFAVSTLRDFGMGKNKLQTRIHEEIAYLLAEIDKQGGQPFDPRTIIATSVSNVICSIVFGKRYDYDDQEFKELILVIRNLMSRAGLATALIYVPVINRLPLVYKSLRDTLAYTTQLIDKIKKIIDYHEETFDESNIRSVIDAFIKEKRKSTDFPDGYIADHELARIIMDLFIAGTDTTATALIWGLAYAVNYPDLQKTIYEEINENIGLERLPRMDDKQKLANVEASTYEILRHADIVPFALPHVVMGSTVLRGYNIPKGTMVFPILDSSLKDPAKWEDPLRFNHKRFMDGNSVKTSEQFIPFGLGKRVCAGESLARMEMFLFWSALIQNFEFLPADEGKPPSLDGKIGITNSPLPYNIIAVRRRK